jgi:GNAT superfamily N-acetyltransferase
MISWVRFEWDLTKGGISVPAVPPLSMRAAAAEDRETVQKVVLTAFELDSAWGDVMRRLEEGMKRHIKRVFEDDEPPCIVVKHGTRIIGASLLLLDPAAESHLLSGPMILHEYRNRGVGSGLLAASLEHLRSRGVSAARGITRANSVVERFIYPKYSGASAPWAGDPLCKD